MATSTTLVSGTGVELPPVIGDLYASAIFSSAAPGPFILATGAPGILITRLFVTIDLLSTQSPAGNIIIQFKDVTANQVIGQIAVYVPTASPTLNAAQVAPAVSSGTGYWYRSRVPNAQIQVAAISGGPLTAGFIRCAMNYALISQDS